MYHKITCKRMSAILIALMVLLSLSGMAQGQMTITVPDDYYFIQDAVDAAMAGDTIYVRAGFYDEAVTISKEQLTLIGDGRHVTIVTEIRVSGVYDFTMSDVGAPVEPHCTDGDCTEYALWCISLGRSPICLWHNKEEKAITLCVGPLAESKLMQHHPDACYGTCYYVNNNSAVCNNIE